MDHYVGLDVSLKETHFCVVDGAGEVVAIRAALEDAGIVFITGDGTIGAALRLRDPEEK